MGAAIYCRVSTEDQEREGTRVLTRWIPGLLNLTFNQVKGN